MALEWAVDDSLIVKPLSAEGVSVGAGGDPLHTRLRSTILYRMGQKRLARDYLQLARLAIGSEMDQMRMLIAEEEAGL